MNSTLNFSSAATAPSAKGYSNNYDGMSGRYDSVNPTYRQGPPAGLVIYEQRGYGSQPSYLDYKKDPFGRWG